jgi:hypothetical protein
MKRWFVLINESGIIMKNEQGQIRMWESATLAMMAIDSEYRSSPYLRPIEWKKRGQEA